MAYAKPRRRKDGTPSGRWTAVYLDHAGTERSAGTYSSEQQALEMAEKQEQHVRVGSLGVDPRVRATMTIEEYFPTWLNNQQIELSTKGHYRQIYKTYVKDRFGKVRVAELEREAIKSLIADLRGKGLGPATQKRVRSLISGMMRDAMEDGYRDDNPASKVRVQKRRGGTRKIKVLTVEQFQDILDQWPTEGAKLLSLVIISTGCRPSESFVLTPDDLLAKKDGAGKIDFNKALQQLEREDAVEGETLVVGPIKTGEAREVDINRSLYEQLMAWIDQHNIGPHDLLFPRDLVFPRLRATSVRKLAIVLTEELIATLGVVKMPSGKEYRHGVWNCYITAKCKCDYCRQAFSDYRYNLAQEKRETRHARGDGAIAPTRTSPYITTQMWRDRFKKAVAAAKVPFMPTAYQLRHTHASWLIAAGVDVKTVASRLGHTTVKQTNEYVHDLGEDEVSPEVMEGLLFG